MSDNQEVTMAELEQLTNDEAEFTPVESETPVAEVESEPAPEVKEAPVEANGQADKFNEINKLLSETPFKSDDAVEGLKKFVEGHKNLQGEFSRTRERVKPFETIIDRASRDPQYRQMLEQLDTMYANPEMAKAYQAQQGQQDIMPDPYAYNKTDPRTGEQYWDKQAYDKDHDAWVQRQLDARLNARFAQIEQRTRLEQFKFDFKQRYPNVQDDPETLLQYAMTEFPRLNPIEAAYRFKSYEAIKAQAIEEARKELNKQLETANKTKTPEGTASKPQTVSPREIIAHIKKHGEASAVKKYGQRDVDALVQAYSE